ncbi:MAG: ABC transporter substrate-binding protein, partial [Bacillota bacterium]
TIVATTDLYTSTDLSKDYTVNMYLIGDTPKDWDQVKALIDEKLAPFNTKLEVAFMSWSDYTTLYPLVLAGGEQVDLIFTAPWCFMYSEAAKGSFYMLSEDFINTYMPLTSQYQADASWVETTIGGEIVAVPSNRAQPMGKIVAVRQDLMDKYGIEPLASWDDFMGFLLTIAQQETPESGIYAMASATDNAEMWDVYRQQYNSFLALDSNYLGLLFSYDGELPAKEDIKLIYEWDWYRDFAKDMKTLADAGAWSRSALTNTVTDDDAFEAGQGASIAWNMSVFNYIRPLEERDPNAYCMAYDLTTDYLVQAEAYSNNDMAIAAGSENPERAAMVLDILKYDTEINTALLLGFEGVHYEWAEQEGYYKRLADKTNDYTPLGISISWAIKNGNIREEFIDPRQQAISDAWDTRVMVNPLVAFIFDDTSVKAYVAAVSSVLNDYVPMLELGLVDDVDATINEMVQKCYDSGLQELLNEFYAQYDAWLTAQ